MNAKRPSTRPETSPTTGPVTIIMRRGEGIDPIMAASRAWFAM
jgi:hypothetical protein